MKASTSMPKLLMEVRNLSASYGQRTILKDIRLDINVGEIVLVTGSNGSGKSTLLKALFGLHQPEKGSIINFHPSGKLIRISDATVKDHLALGLAYVPQKEGLFNDLTVLDNLRISGHQLSRKELEQSIGHVISLFPWLSTYLNRKPLSLSGGEYQIVAIAMALLHQPRLLLIDEPIAGLASSRATQVASVLQRMRDIYNTSMIIVEHRISELKVLDPKRIDLHLGHLSIR